MAVMAMPELVEILSYWANRWPGPPLEVGSGRWAWSRPGASVYVAQGEILQIGLVLTDAGRVSRPAGRRELDDRWSGLLDVLDADGMPAEPPLLGPVRIPSLARAELPPEGPLEIGWVLPWEGGAQELAERSCGPIVWCQWFAEEFLRDRRTSREPDLAGVDDFLEGAGPDAADPVVEVEFSLMRRLVAGIGRGASSRWPDMVASHAVRWRADPRVGVAGVRAAALRNEATERAALQQAYRSTDGGA